MCHRKVMKKIPQSTYVKTYLSKLRSYMSKYRIDEEGIELIGVDSVDDIIYLLVSLRETIFEDSRNVDFDLEHLEKIVNITKLINKTLKNLRDCYKIKLKYSILF